MKYFFGVFLFFSFQNLAHAQDSNLTKYTNQQLSNYIRNISDGKKDADLYAWALLESTYRNTDAQKFIIENIENSSKNSFPIQFNDGFSYSETLVESIFKTQSSLLLLHHILNQYDDVENQKTFQKYLHKIGFQKQQNELKKIIESVLNYKPINSNILSITPFKPEHYFLVTSDRVLRNNLLKKEYLKKALSSWSNSTPADLKSALRVVTQIRIAYELYDYEKVKELSAGFLNTNYFPISIEKLRTLRQIDYSMYRLGYYEKSIDITQNYNLPLADYLGLKNLTEELKVDLGATLFRVGRIEESTALFEELLHEIDSSSTVSRARLYNNLAINYWKSGEFNQFLEYEFEALKAVERAPNYEIAFDVYKNLFNHYRSNKNYASARTYLNKATSIAQKQNNALNIAQTQFLKGQLYRDAEADFPKALEAFNEALKFITVENNYRSYQNILIEEAKIREQQRKYAEAQQLYDTIIKQADERQDQRNALFAKFSKAAVYIHSEQAVRAHAILDSLQNENLAPLEFPRLVKARLVQAHYQQQVGDPGKGIAILKPVIEQVLQRSRGSGSLESGYWQIEPEYVDAFEHYARLLISDGRKAQAVEVLDRFKTINDAALYQNPLVRSKALSEVEMSTYTRLTEQLNELRRQLLAAPADEKTAIRQEIDEKSASKTALDRKLSINADLAPLRLRDIQQQLDGYKRVLHITEVNDTYFVALISRTAVSMKLLPITPSVRKMMNTAIEQLNEGTTDVELLYDVSQYLKLPTLPAHLTELTVVPDSYLYQLPLELMPMSQPDDPKSYGTTDYFIEHYRTTYRTSLRDFYLHTGSQKYSLDFAGYAVSSFGDDRQNLVPLPKADAEVQTAAAKLTAFKNKKTFLNDEATEQHFRTSAPHAKVLHLATHSKVSNQDPMFSSIYFNRADSTRAPAFPGRVFAYQLFQLNLSNDLVMMNSCESGSGRYIQGTGVVGISRALRYAGAKSLVLNLWSVNDMFAADFSTLFYDGINKGQKKSEAMRAAKLQLLNSSNANPHYWASHMLLGNDEAVIVESNYNRLAAILFVTFFFSLAIASTYIEWKRQRTPRIKAQP